MIQLSSSKLKKIVISNDTVTDVKNIGRGILSPIKGFMNKETVSSVTSSMKLSNGMIFPIPFLFSISKKEAKNIILGQKVMLMSIQGQEIASFIIEDKFDLNRNKLAKEIFKTNDINHPGVQNLLLHKEVFIGGEILLINNLREPFSRYNLDPKETRAIFKKNKWKSIAGFQTRNIIHRGHEYLQKKVLESVDGLFINPVIGKKKKGDFKDEIIIQTYIAVIKKYYPKEKVLFSILPYNMQYAGPREAVLHAIIRKNYGCTHFIVGRDHAGVGTYYKPYEAQEIFEQIGDMGIQIIKQPEVFYCIRCKKMKTHENCKHLDKDHMHLSATYIRNLLLENKPLPSEIIRPEVVDILLHSSNLFV